MVRCVPISVAITIFLDKGKPKKITAEIIDKTIKKYLSLSCDNKDAIRRNANAGERSRGLILNKYNILILKGSESASIKKK
jgi:hypothetical protein